MTDEEKASDYEMDCIAEVYRDDVCIIPYAYSAQKLEQAYLDGLAEGRKNCMTVQNAMETIKRYCKEITDENNNCSKCIFCSKGFNGCKLQTAPCEWE